MTEADYLLYERIAIKMDSGIDEAVAIEQATQELSARQSEMFDVHG